MSIDLKDSVFTTLKDTDTAVSLHLAGYQGVHHLRIGDQCVTLQAYYLKPLAEILMYAAKIKGIELRYKENV